MRLAIGLTASALVAAAALYAFSDRHIPPLEASQPYASHMAVSNMSLSAADVLVVAGEQGHIFYSSDDGATWSPAQLPEKRRYAQVNDIVFSADGKEGLALGHEGLLMRSTDGGKSWEEIRFTDDGMGEALQSAIQLNDGRWLAVGAFGMALESSDGGKSWQRFDFGVEEVSDRHLNKLIASADKNNLLLLAESGSVLQSTDGGTSWALVPHFYDGSLYGGLSLGDGAWLVYGMRGNAFSTQDGGQTWRRAALSHQFSLLNHYRGAEGEIYLLGLNGSIVKSTDGGRSFAEVRRGPQAALLGMVPAKDGGWLVATESGMRHYSAEFLLDGETEIPVDPAAGAAVTEAAPDEVAAPEMSEESVEESTEAVADDALLLRRVDDMPQIEASETGAEE